MGNKNRGKKTRNDKPAAPAIQEYSTKLGILEWTLVCLVPFLVYLHTISFAFVWDDETQILRNPWIRDWSKVVQFFTTDVWAFSRTDFFLTNYYRPLHMVAYAVGYSLSGFRPEGYHLINIVLHVVSTLLVARIALQLTQEKPMALMSGLIFALHPIHAESITWIAAVPDPLCAVFYLGALALYLKDGISPGNKKNLAGILLLFLCALLSKEMAFVFPLVAVWADWCLRPTLRWSRYALLTGVFAIYGVLRISALGFRPGIAELSLKPRFLSSTVLLASDVVRVFVPYGLTPYHVFHPTRSFVDARFWLSAAVLALVALFAWWRRKDRPVLFLTGFLGIALLPLMSIVDIGQETVFADRYLYIPSVSACILIPLLVQSALRLRPQAAPFFRRRAVCFLVSPLLLVYGVLLIQTSFLWRDPQTLYSKTLDRSPDSRRFTSLLAQYYYGKADYQKAETVFLRLINLCQNSTAENNGFFAEAYAGLGSILFERGHYAEAKQYFEKAYAVDPHFAGALQDLGSVNMALGDYPAAFKYYQAALAMNSRDATVYYNLATLYLRARQYQAAIELARKAIEIYPNLSRAYICMGHSYRGLGMKQNAREAFQKAAQIEPAQQAVVDAVLKDLDK